MRVRRILGAWVAVLLAATPASGQPLDLESILDSASAYVSRLVRELSNLVADEQYIQDLRRQGVGPSPGSVPHRELKADLLLVKLPRTMTWLPFRDVYEVDGRAVRDHDDRLETLFLRPSETAVEHATRISEESARYNIGAMRRTINNPMTALVFLQRDYRERFQFTVDGPDPDRGPNVWVIAYRETGRPTLVKGARNRDMPAHGRFWIEPATGRVVQSEMSLEDVDVRATITTTFAPDVRFQVNVPREMRERYTLRGGQIVGRATYGDFRTFTVEAGVASTRQARTISGAAGITLLELPAGRFTMGSVWADPGRHDDEVPHEVTIERPFYLGRFEVTQRQWLEVTGKNPSRFAACGPDCPVENVSFADVEAFLAALNARPDAQLTYRLPTEAEWEYACYAGGTAPYATGSSLKTSQANYNGTLAFTPTGLGLFRKRPTPVGTFPDNAWGLADMHGNVLEWTADWYGDYSSAAVSNPRGPAAGQKRVVRGGSWFLDVGDARCATRRAQPTGDANFQTGFRLAASPRSPSPAETATASATQGR